MCLGWYIACYNFRLNPESFEEVCQHPSADPPRVRDQEACRESQRWAENHPDLIPQDWKYEDWGFCKTKREAFGRLEATRYGTPELRDSRQLCVHCRAKAKAAELEKDRGVKIKKEEDDDGDQQGGWGGYATGQSNIALKG